MWTHICIGHKHDGFHTWHQTSSCHKMAHGKCQIRSQCRKWEQFSCYDALGHLMTPPRPSISSWGCQNSLQVILHQCSCHLVSFSTGGTHHSDKTQGQFSKYLPVFFSVTFTLTPSWSRQINGLEGYTVNAPLRKTNPIIAWSSSFRAILTQMNGSYTHQPSSPVLF